MAQSRWNQGLRLPRKVNRFLPMTDDLTDRQRAVLDFIRGHAASEGMPPTLQQIDDAFGLRQACAAHKHVRRRQAARYLERRPTDASGVSEAGRVGTTWGRTGRIAMATN